MQIPDICYRHTSKEETVAKEQRTFTPTEAFVVDDGLYLFLQGAEYPLQGIVTPEAMSEINIAKRLLAKMLQVATRWWMVPSVLLIALLPWKQKVKVVNYMVVWYTEIAFKFMRNHILKTQVMTGAGQELEWLVYLVLDTLKTPEWTRDRFSEILSTMIDRDTAYRYRFRDIMDEVHKENLLKKPTRELLRLTKIYGKRERDRRVRRNGVVLGVLLAVVALHPKVRTLLRTVVRQVNIHRMGYDDCDTYWVLFQRDVANVGKDYQFLGKTYEERQELLGDAGRPVLIEKTWE